MTRIFVGRGGGVDVARHSVALRAEPRDKGGSKPPASKQSEHKTEGKEGVEGRKGTPVQNRAERMLPAENGPNAHTAENRLTH